MPQHREDRGAGIARRRGEAAAMIDDPVKRKRFIAEQGERERKKGGPLSASEYAELGTEAKRVTDKAAAGVPGFSFPTSRRRKREGY
jgi:hypothetical protein